MDKQIKDFFEKRLLRKIEVDVEKVKNSMRIAESKLVEAKKLFKAEFFSQAVLAVYTSMFHIARALLYKEGIQEKSHYATYKYLESKFSDKITSSSLSAFDCYREIRHEILYGFEEIINSAEAEEAILNAENFLGEIKRIL